ncbi:hypothetical protein [Mucilaginibacter sp. 3215]|uniref:hypothetical protein n=1 Tax=Mucilaginibacter sp. 3215 TaxID=3373912 RepID=UPI003D1E577B
MKYFAAILLLFVLKTQALGQTKDYAITMDTRVFKWNESTQSPDSNNHYYRAIRGNIFTVKQKIKTLIGAKPVSGYRIVFWPFSKDGSQKKPEEEAFARGLPVIDTLDKAINGLSFFIKDEDFVSSATDEFKKKQGLFKVDGVVLPVKLRFRNKTGGDFDFGQSISVGPALNWTINYGGAFSENTLSILFGANISSIDVDEKTVPKVVTSKTTLLGLTPFAGFNWEFHGVSFGVMTGIDILSGKAEDNWAYRKSPWLGFTIGTSLISTKKEKQ